MQKFMCPECGGVSEQLLPPVMAEALERKCGLPLLWCPPCVEKVAFRKGQRRTQIEAQKAADEQKWAELCPLEYRTTEEHGRTDLACLAQATGVYAKDGNTTPVDAESLKGCFRLRPLLLIAGAPGTMKTRTAWRIARLFWNEKPRLIRCFSSWSFQASAQDASGTFNATNWMRGLETAPFLFLDDLGKAEWTANTHSAFFDLIERRTANWKPTLITTNETFDRIREARQTHKSIAAQSTADGLIRRIRELGITIVMKTPQ